VTECKAEQSYQLNDAQLQRMSLEALLGETSPSWIIAGAVIRGVTDLARFHDVLLELPRAYPVLRTTLMTAGPAESWHQYIRSCAEIRRGRSPVVQLSTVSSWSEMIEAMREDLETRNPDYRYAAAYCTDSDGCIRIVFAFDHMVFDIRSIDIVLAHLARSADGEGEDENRSACRCGANEFANYVRRTAATGEAVHLPERYEWALELMLAGRSPHAYVSLPLARPLSAKDGGRATRIRSRFVTDAHARHSYTPFASFVSALALSLEANFGSPAMFYTPNLNRTPAEMDSVGWFAGTPIMPVRSAQIMPAVAAERILNGEQATSEARAAITETMRDGQELTTLIHRRLTAALGGRLPFMDCVEDSQPYLVLGYADRVRDRVEWKAKNIVVTRTRLPTSVFAPSLVPPGYIFIRLFRVQKAEWLVEADYETERYQSGTMETLLSAMERYLRQLLG
jgi:hypothetical protein